LTHQRNKLGSLRRGRELASVGWLPPNLKEEAGLYKDGKNSFNVIIKKKTTERVPLNKGNDYS